MRLTSAFAAAVAGAVGVSSVTASAAEALGKSEKIRVLVVTGGHGFEREPFFKMFQDNPEITCQAAEHPNAHKLFTADAGKEYDVIVTYDFNRKITQEAKADFVARLQDGKGLVALHHAIATYPEWPEYWNIIGARYYLAATNVNGVAKARSAYKHDVDFKVQIADRQHPVTRGVKDFAIHDETYKWFDVFPDCHPLLTTDEPESNKVIGWAKKYEQARVVYIQLGHDHFAFENPSYRQIVRQAIRWAAKR